MGCDGFPGSGGQQIHEFAAAQRLHDDNGDAFRGSGPEAIHARLGGFVQIIVLDLAEIPVIVLQDLQELVRVAVIRKADVPDGARLFLPGDPFADAEFFQLLPLGEIRELVHQVVVDVIGAKPFQTFIEVPVDGGRPVNHVLGELGRDEDLIADPVALEDFAQRRFASGIQVGGIIIVYTSAVRGQDLLFGRVEIDSAGFAGKSHASVSEDRQRLSVSVFSVLHKGLGGIYVDEEGGVALEVTVDLVEARVERAFDGGQCPASGQFDPELGDVFAGNDIDRRGYRASDVGDADLPGGFADEPAHVPDASFVTVFHGDGNHPYIGRVGKCFPLGQQPCGRIDGWIGMQQSLQHRMVRLEGLDDDLALFSPPSGTPHQLGEQLESPFVASEVLHGEKKFVAAGFYRVMVKYVAPALIVAVLVSEVCRSFGIGGWKI